jgi:hypothetical protein
MPGRGMGLLTLFRLCISPRRENIRIRSPHSKKLSLFPPYKVCKVLLEYVLKGWSRASMLVKHSEQSCANQNFQSSLSW